MHFVVHIFTLILRVSNLYWVDLATCIGLCIFWFLAIASLISSDILNLKKMTQCYLVSVELIENKEMDLAPTLRLEI